MLDGTGQALAAASAETVRKTWWKVCRDKEAMAAGTTRQQRAKQRRAASLPPSPARGAPGGEYGMLPSGIEPPEEPLPEYTFEFMREKDWTKDANKGDE